MVPLIQPSTGPQHVNLHRESSPGRRAAYSVKHGDRYGRLTATHRMGRDARGNWVWLLECSCGGLVTRSAAVLNWSAREGAAQAPQSASLPVISSTM